MQRRADSTVKESTKGAVSGLNRGDNESGTRASIQQETKVRKVKDETIVIHVCDEFRNINRDFTCNKSLLLENMRYFKGYLNEENANEDIDISVHCDVGIFEWLYSFIHASPTKPKLAIDNVTSILISSEFLQMDYLVNECTTFIGQNLESVVDMPGDLLSVSEVILESIAVKCSLEQLDVIEPRKEKLCHKLYSKRLARLISTLKHTEKGLELCSFCGVVYYKGHRPFLTCSQATPSIGRNGQVLLLHVPKTEWKSDAWIKSLGTSNPRHAFWKLWGTLQCLYCTNCQNYFTSSEIKECLHHEPPQVADTTKYNCCGAPKFAADSRATRGCKMQHHLLGRSVDLRSHYESTLELDRIHELTLNHIDIIARDKPTIPPTIASGNVHEMLRASVCAPKSMLEYVDAPSDAIKSIKSNNTDVSTPQTRKQWKIDLLQEKDRIRVQLLSSNLTKMRSEYRPATHCEEGNIFEMERIESVLTTDTFTNDRYEELFYQSVIPQIPKLRGVVVFLHGFGDHSSGYMNFFEHLAESGYAVFAFDYIGHGKSEGERVYFEKYQYMIDDIDQFITLCKSEVEKANLIVNKWNLIGISFGGLLSALTIVRELHPFDSVVLLAPSINVPLTWVLWIQKQFAYVLSTFFPTWRIVPGVVRENLSRDENVLHEFDMDELSFHGLAPARSGEQILCAMDELSSMKSSFTTPLLMIMGDDERIVCPTSIREFYRDVQSQDKELIVFEGVGHMFMRETKHLEVENRIIQWLNERCPFPTK